MDEFWGLNKDSQGFNPKMKMDRTFDKDKFYSQKKTKQVYQYPLRSSEVHGWLEPIDDMVFLGYEREKMSGEFTCGIRKSNKKHNII